MLIALRLLPGTEVATHGTGAVRGEVQFVLFTLLIGSLVAYGATAVFGVACYMGLSQSMRSDPRSLAGVGAVAGICTLLVIAYELGTLSWPVVPWLTLLGLMTGALAGWLFWIIGLRGAG